MMKELESLLHTECLTVTGKMLKDNLAVVKKQRIPAYEDIIRTIEKPLHAEGGIAVLYGNLTPNGAVIKPKAATERMLTHEGRAVVFNSIEDLEQRIDQEDLDINADDVLVLRNAGPIGGPGMPEAGMLPIPKKLLAQGVRDMVRISDCRMSGTAGGTVVLHITPEAAVGGPLSLVQSGDRIRLDVPNRSLELLVSDEVLDKRRESLQITIERSYPRGYGWLFQQHVMQADKGCDFDFLQANFQSEKK